MFSSCGTAVTMVKFVLELTQSEWLEKFGHGSLQWSVDSMHMAQDLLHPRARDSAGLVRVLKSFEESHCFVQAAIVWELFCLQKSFLLLHVRCTSPFGATGASFVLPALNVSCRFVMVEKPRLAGSRSTTPKHERSSPINSMQWW